MEIVSFPCRTGGKWEVSDRQGFGADATREEAGPSAVSLPGEPPGRAGQHRAAARSRLTTSKGLAGGGRGPAEVCAVRRPEGLSGLPP